MNIAIVGSGRVGQALGGAWKTAGHAVTFGMREPAGETVGLLAQGACVVQALAEEIGFEAVDAGPLKASRYLEPMAMQWIKLAYGGMGTAFSYALVRR